MRLPTAAAFADQFVDERTQRAPLNEAAFSDFYARTAGPLCGYLRRLTGSATVAEELTQEAYLRFLGIVRVPEGDDHRRNYLFRIGTNLARDHFRQVQRDRRYLAEAGLEADPVARDAAPDCVADGRDVRRILSSLSTRDRELLLLAYVEGLSHQEISQITGLMRASIKPLLFRARRRFAAALRDLGITESSLLEAVS